MMFGLFKTKISAVELGQGIIHLANETLASDSDRALAERFEDYDGSGGWDRILERQGVSIQTQGLHYRLFAHCAVQGTCTQYNEPTRRVITESAMKAFKKTDGYDFQDSYNALEAAYRGEHKFIPRIESLDYPHGKPNFLPNPNVGLINARFLLQSFVIRHMQNSAVFVTEQLQFEGYTATVQASIGTVQRAIEYISQKFKVPKASHGPARKNEGSMNSLRAIFSASKMNADPLQQQLAQLLIDAAERRCGPEDIFEFFQRARLVGLGC
jgi:hypothetical protein